MGRVAVDGRVPPWVRSWFVPVVLALAACATPIERIEDRATALGFQSMRLAGAGFHHLAFVAGLPQHSQTLHVYVEHDGTPWANRSRVAPDPTPRMPVALELMARDAGPRLFLGRPCYFGSAGEPRCTPLMWTHRRYSAEVVHSMAAALRGFLSAHRYDRVVLIGYSGGGTVAWLMASEIPETVEVVTIAANLDTDYWSALHGYSPLAGSLNPALQPVLAPEVEQIHYAGGRDRNVPPTVAGSFVRRHPKASVIVIADFDHQCCWIEQWPRLLDQQRPAPDLERRPPA